MSYLTLYAIIAICVAIIQVPFALRETRHEYGAVRFFGVMLACVMFGIFWPITILLIIGKFLKKALN